MKITAFAASSSKQSINKKLVSYAVNLINGAEIDLLDLNDYELPLFSQDKEQELGQPDLAKAFLAKIAQCDALIISFAEHNGCYSAAYKNIFDWCSRINNKVFQQKPMLLLSTSPGGRGGQSVLTLAENSAPFFAGNVKASMAIPSFHENFDTDKNCLTNEDIHQKLLDAIQLLINDV